MPTFRCCSPPPPMPPPAGALVDIIGKPADPNLPIVGHFDQRTMLVRGQNNIDVWGHDADRMAAVARRRSPVQDRHRPAQGAAGPQRLDEPEGRRHAGGRLHRADLACSMLYNPPGVGSSGTIAIPEDQNEAVDPAHRQRRRGDRHLEDRRHRPRGTRWRRRRVLVAARRPEHRRPVLQVHVRQGRRRAGQGNRSRREGRESRPTLPARPRCELVGLPANTTTTPIEFTKDTTELVFKVDCDQGCPARPLSVADLRDDVSRSTANRSRTRSAPANCGSTPRCRPSPTPRPPRLRCRMPAAAPAAAPAPDEASDAAGTAAARKRTSKAKSRTWLTSASPTAQATADTNPKRQRGNPIHEIHIVH